MLHDLVCVIHLHSTHSDGTGTVAEIADAGRRNALDAVLLTDHDSLAARRLGEEGWYGETLVLAGCEVSPSGGNHLLAFGLDAEVRHEGLDCASICAAVRAAGGFGFAAHPWSQGSARFKRGRPMPFADVGCADGVELWSFVNDTLEPVQSLREIASFLRRPESLVIDPPERNLLAWEAVCRERRCVAIGGVDAHQVGVRIGGRVPLRLMSYARSFRHIRTHVLVPALPSGSLEEDRALVFDALRSGRCYLSHDALAPARGFSFGADGVPMGAELTARPVTLEASAPRPADLLIRRDGEVLARAHGTHLGLEVSEPGAYYAIARLDGRTWVVTNPVYLR